MLNSAPTPQQISDLYRQILTVEGRIDTALDRGMGRDFAAWCKSRNSLSGRIQTLLVREACS